VLGLQASTNEAAAVMERMIGIYDQAAQSILNQSLIAGAARIPSLSAPEPAAPVRPRDSEPKPVSAAQAKRMTLRPRAR
jgi:hypothetical protein